jgi:DNA polymerase I-like protein with 3'-5' exonuclease and polymerase domains
VNGAGANALAPNAGSTLCDSKKFIKVFYSRYKGVALFHEAIIKESQDKRRITANKSPKGFPVGAYTKRMPTGRIYVFTEYDNDWKGGVSFSPTELKNWPVQGFATGDVVPHMVGHIVRCLYATALRHNCKPIMTVHDSIVFDVHEKYVDKFVKACYNILKNTTPIIERHFSMELPVTLSVGCSVGKNWQDLEEVELTSL